MDTLQNHASDQFELTFLQKSIKTLKSYKFIPLMYQLAARMDTKAQSQSFQATLNNVSIQMHKLLKFVTQYNTLDAMTNYIDDLFVVMLCYSC